jgi:hypothetical protein
MIDCAAGGAVVKYGSLLVSLPHEPNAALALTLVVGTPILYAAALLLRSRGGSNAGGHQGAGR